MKGLSIFNKMIFFVNSLFATALLLAYILPYIPPKTFPFLAILCLGVPVLLVFNALFMVYWVFKLKKQLLLSLLVLLLGFNHILSLYKFTDAKEIVKEGDVKLMSYNVRQFNRYDWIKDDSLTHKIIGFVKEENPAILCIQEYFERDEVNFDNFKHKFVKLKGGNSRSGQAILSNLPILKTGSLDFVNTENNAIYADVLMGKDTVRVFNVHLESLKINPDIKKLQKEDSKKLIGRVGESFRKQEYQVDKVLKAIRETSYKSIVCGDLNNSAFSYVYRRLSDGYQDAFKQAGTGFGKTFDLDFLPLRIDVFLVDPAFEIDGFVNYDIELSDHYPISTTIRLKDSQ